MGSVTARLSDCAPVQSQDTRYEMILTIRVGLQSRELVWLCSCPMLFSKSYTHAE